MESVGQSASDQQNGQRPDQITDLFRHVLQTAKTDPLAARQVRDAVLASGLLEVFDLTRAADESETIDLLDLLEAGGEDALRARMAQLGVAELHEIIEIHNYDPRRETSRWRSTRKLVDHIVVSANAELNRENGSIGEPALAGTAWLL
ncbi:MAG TPA: hypothetical protein VH349_15735 [Ktedonobacterales bacterium]|jgi:hypothetical protein